MAYEIFQTVVEQGSFQRATKVLNLTPSVPLQSVTQFQQQDKELGFLYSQIIGTKKAVALRQPFFALYNFPKHSLNKNFTQSYFYRPYKAVKQLEY